MPVAISRYNLSFVSQERSLVACGRLIAAPTYSIVSAYSIALGKRELLVWGRKQAATKASI